MEKKDLNLTIFELLKQGKRPIQISKELNIKLSRLSYYLTKFKELGIIKKVGYGTWEVQINTLNTLTKKDKKIRGHAFIWTLKLNKEFDWKQLVKDYRLVRGLTPRILINGRKVWLGKKTITIYEPKSFYGKNSIESRKYAVIGFLEVLEALQKQLGINLRPYIFKLAREHYGMIKNDLARQYNRNNEKMIIHDDIEGDWLWIDDSESLGELETKNIVRSKQVQDWWNDNKRHNFKVTPTFLMETLAIQQNQLNQFTQQIKSHLALINEYRKENKAWRKSEVKIIKKELKEGYQTKLGEF